MPPPEPIDADRIVRHGFVARVEFHPRLGSTNDHALQRAADRSIALPLLVVADKQTAGRGREGRRWWSGTGGLAMSLLVDGDACSVSGRPAPLVAPAAGLAVVDCAERLLAGHAPVHDLGLHWPNDVFIDGGKLAGVLVEVLGRRAVIGIGMNTNNTAHEAPEELRAKIRTLRDLTGRSFDPTEVLIELLAALRRRLDMLREEPDRLAAAADARCLQRGRRLRVQSGTERFEGICRGLARDGALILETATATRHVHSGTVLPD